MKKLNKTACIIGVLVFIWSFECERWLLKVPECFAGSYVIKIGLYTVAKLLLIIGVYWGTDLLMGLLVGCICGNLRARTSAVFILFLLIPMTVFLLLTWPGAWTVDAPSVLAGASNLNIYGVGQGLYITIFYLSCAMLIPNAGGIVLIQVVLIACMLGSIYSWIWHNISKFCAAICLIVSLMPISVFYTTLPLRFMWSGAGLLWLGYQIIRSMTEDSFSWKQQVWLAFQGGGIAAIRPEMAYLLFLYPLLILSFHYKKISKHNWYRWIIILIIPVVTWRLVSSITMSISPTKDNGEAIWYKLSGTVTGMEALLSFDGLDEEKYKDELEKIEVFCSLEDFRRYASPYDSAVLYMAKWNREITKDEANDYIRAYFRLIEAYPGIWLYSRLESFIGMTFSRNADGRLFIPMILRCMPVADLNPCLHAWNEELRRKTYLLTQIEMEEGRVASMSLRLITWNTIIPVLLCLIAALLAFLKRSWRWLFILGIPLGQMFVIFLALTQSHQMFAMTYYWPGYIFSMIAIKNILFARIS